MFNQEVHQRHILAFAKCIEIIDPETGLRLD